MKTTLHKSVRVVWLDSVCLDVTIKNGSVGFDYDLYGDNVSCDWSSMGNETAKQLLMAVGARMNAFNRALRL